MEKELVAAEQAVRKIEKFGLGDVIRPLVREIFLDDVFVRGVLFCGGRLKKIEEGDELLLMRKKAPYDEYTVAVYHGKERIGELAEADEKIFARLLDAGKKLTARAKRIMILPDCSALEISISMTDF